MNRLVIFKKLIGILCLLVTSIIYAHGNLTIRINELTKEITKHPKNSELYFKRGYLYEQHEEFNNAIDDYLKSEKLGNSIPLLHYRKAQTYLNNHNFHKALESSHLYLEKDSIDVKINKLHAQILIQLSDYQKALKYYNYFIENTVDINPDDVIEYSKIYLSIDGYNYQKAVEVIDAGLRKLGKDTFSLQLKKLEYLEASLQINEAIEQYNYFILTTNRNEFWYYKKAKYLFEHKHFLDSKIAIQQAKTAIILLNDKFQNTTSIKTLNANITNLENKF